ncbi:hypothetical protein HaLaN_26366 [Haematococcus lacustris]|uniref:Uncharacterized protein n=1 Tax=Haematococcus lacustris TaxID=44745 RepID=A0A6A0A623_HAELA|nr:hypothetical protein HaLaN_26366 [Haematococcus lacustris]
MVPKANSAAAAKDPRAPACDPPQMSSQNPTMAVGFSALRFLTSARCMSRPEALGSRAKGAVTALASAATM